MQIRFFIQFQGDRLVEVIEDPSVLTDADRQVLKSMHYLAGAVELAHGEQPPLELRDDLVQLVPRLCIWSQPKLAAGEVVRIGLFTDPNEVILTPVGQSLRIEGTWGEVGEFPLSECLAKLRDGGQRFVQFAIQNLCGEEKWQGTIDDLKYALRSLGTNEHPDDNNDRYAVSPEEIERILAENAQEPPEPQA
jgi:hypothetical protein